MQHQVSKEDMFAVDVARGPQYFVSEEELNRLWSSVHQLDLILDLSVNLSGPQPITIDGLASFLTAQRDALSATLASAEERRVAESELNRDGIRLSWLEWSHALEIARGRARYTPKGSEARIAAALDSMATVDANWRGAAKLWSTVCAEVAATAEEPAPSPAPAATAPTTAAPRRRERLTAGA